MKKIITVSLVAMMAVSAAHADLASTAYVKGKTGDLQYSTGLEAGQELKYVSNNDVLTTAVAKLDQAIKTVGGDLDDFVVTTDVIEDNAVTSEKIKNGEVKTDDIADLAVTTEKIADSAVTSGKIFDGTIAIADLSSEVTGMMDGHQLKSNIQTDTNHDLSTADQNIKYTSVSYVDTKIATANANVTGLQQTVTNNKNAQDAINADFEAAIGENAADIGLEKNDAGAVTSFDKTNYLTEATTLTGAALTLDATIKTLDGGINTLSDDKQDKLSGANVTSTGDGVVKTVVGADGLLTVTRDQVVDADVANDAITTLKIKDENVTTAKIANDAVTTVKILDKNVTKAKLADDVQTLIDGALPRSTLEGAAKLDADKGDGQYALTMKVENGVMTYQWDLISY